MSDEQCPCCSKKNYAECCGPLLHGKTRAKTAEQLMRSRYTAFSKKDNDYLLASWATTTRPQELDTDDTSIRWIGLEILETEKGGEQDDSGTVQFAARFIVSSRLCCLREKSRFIKEDDNWFYVDGIPESTTEKIARNSPCPCGSGKKFKRCCL